MLTDLDLGWLAGIIDGEGSLNVYVGKSGSIAVEVRVEACSLTMMDGIRRCYDAAAIQYKLRGPFRRKLSTKDVYRISVYRAAEVLKLLKLLDPVLVVKAEEARVTISWFERWPDQRETGIVRASTKERTDFYDTMKLLKKVA